MHLSASTAFAPSAALVARFQDDLALVLPAGGSLGLAISGGPDSLALLLLAKAAGLPIAVATVDHGLRPEARAEAEFVARLCAERGIAHDILPLAGPVQGNVSAWARTARYAALADWQAKHGLDAIATAHHADDQLETLIMRLNRGAGVSGLAGIRPRQGQIIRPLLDWRKAELEALVAQAGITPVQDPSNGDLRFDRARVRQALLEVDWLNAKAASQSARALQSAEAALNWACEMLFATRVERGAPGHLQVAAQDVPFDLQRRMIWQCLREINPEAAPRDDEVIRLVQRLNAGATATLAGVKCQGGAIWRFSAAPPPRKN